MFDIFSSEEMHHFISISSAASNVQEASAARDFKTGRTLTTIRRDRGAARLCSNAFPDPMGNSSG